MTKSEIVKALKEQAGLATLAQAEATYEKLFALIGETLKNGDAASKAVKFTAGKALKESL